MCTHLCPQNPRCGLAPATSWWLSWNVQSQAIHRPVLEKVRPLIWIFAKSVSLCTYLASWGQQRTYSLSFVWELDKEGDHNSWQVIKAYHSKYLQDRCKQYFTVAYSTAALRQRCTTSNKTLLRELTSKCLSHICIYNDSNVTIICRQLKHADGV